MFGQQIDSFLDKGHSIIGFIIVIVMINFQYSIIGIKYRNKEISKEAYFNGMLLVEAIFIMTDMMFPQLRVYICLFLLIATIVNFIFYKLNG